MRTPSNLIVTGTLVALSAGFGPCSNVPLDNGPPVDAYVVPDAVDVINPTQCYFTSLPEHSNHCVVGPCTLTGAEDLQLACTTASGESAGLDDFQEGPEIFAADPTGAVAVIYPDGATMFPTCTGGAHVGTEPEVAGSYQSTGLPVGTPALQVETDCDNPVPAVSTEQCYFSMIPQASKLCIEAPCSITNAATAIQQCTDANDTYFAIGTATYGTRGSNDVDVIIANSQYGFSGCTGGGSALPEGVLTGANYAATGLRVGSTSPADLAAQCMAIMPTP